MNSSYVCHAQIITELLQVSLHVWEEKQKVEIDKTVKMPPGKENLFFSMDASCESACPG